MKRQNLIFWILFLTSSIVVCRAKVISGEIFSGHQLLQRHLRSTDGVCSKDFELCTKTSGICVTENDVEKCLCPKGRDYDTVNGCLGVCSKGLEKCTNTSGKCVTENDVEKCICPRGRHYSTLNGCLDDAAKKCEETGGTYANEKCTCPKEEENFKYEENIGCPSVCPKGLEKCTNTSGKCVTENDAEKCVCPKDMNYDTVNGCLEVFEEDKDCPANKKCDGKLCKCRPGYGGNDCTDLTGCTKELKKQCKDVGATCIYAETEPYATCQCKAGYTYKDSKCLIDCSDAMAKCKNTNGHCIKEKDSDKEMCVCLDGSEYRERFGCQEETGLSDLAIIGIVLAVVAATVLIIVAVLCCKKKKQSSSPIYNMRLRQDTISFENTMYGTNTETQFFRKTETID